MRFLNTILRRKLKTFGPVFWNALIIVKAPCCELDYRRISGTRLEIFLPAVPTKNSKADDLGMVRAGIRTGSETVAQGISDELGLLITVGLSRRAVALPAVADVLGDWGGSQ
jgi:hypothetical protein